MTANRFTDFLTSAPNPNIPHVLDVSPEELRKKKQDVKIIDVRRPDEWVGEFGHIAEAELIVLDTLPDRLPDLPPDLTLVFVCRSGQRSARAAAYALENGFRSVFNMKGGMIEWTQKDFETVERNGG